MRIPSLLCGFIALLIIPLGHAAAQDTEPLPLGEPLPEATLYDVEQSRSVSTSALKGNQATAIIFWSNQCLWVDRYEDRVQALSADVADQGVQVVLVNANDAEAFADENRSASAERAQSYEQMRYLRDDNATFARQMGAERTPHAFLFDAEGTLVYRGGIDDSPGNPNDVSTAYLREAIQATLNGESVSESDTRPFGCMLKPPR